MMMTLIERYFGNCSLHRMDVRGDFRGSLIAIEAGSDVPFQIARVYYIYGTVPGVARGFHAHLALSQWAICVSGSCVMTIDDGSARQDILMDRPDLGLLIGPMIWREMRDFTPDCVLLVLASAAYDEADYIRDYNTFLAHARAGNAA